MSNCSIWPINRTLSGVTTQGQSVPGSNGNERVLHITQNSSITGTLRLDCLVSYPGHSLGVVLPLHRDAVSVFNSLSQLGCYVSKLNPSTISKTIWDMVPKITRKQQSVRLKHFSTNNIKLTTKKGIANL